MAQAPEDLSMFLFKGAKGQLATRALALTMAESILKNVYGNDEYAAQLPLRISDGVDRWIIKGSKAFLPTLGPEESVLTGPVEIVILKYNCQVIQLIQPTVFQPPD